MEKFVERNDPRGTRAFMDPDWVQREDPSEVNAAPNGNQNKCNSHTTLPYFMALL